MKVKIRKIRLVRIDNVLTIKRLIVKTLSTAPGSSTD